MAPVAWLWFACAAEADPDPPPHRDFALCLPNYTVTELRQPTGWVRCTDGSYRQEQSTVRPEPGRLCPPPDSCNTACAANERCLLTTFFGLVFDCACADTCASDSDCAVDEVCGPSELFPYGIAHCIPGADLLSGQCELSRVRVVRGVLGWYEERPVEIACATPGDTCGGSADCDGECRPVGGVWTCVPWPEGWNEIDEVNFVLEP